MSTVANTTPILTTVTKTATKEKTPKETDAAPRVNILDFCEEHYKDILPVIMDKIRRDKRKEVHARLDFGESPKKSRRMREGSQNSSVRTLPARIKGRKETRDWVLGFKKGGKRCYKRVWGDRVWVWRNGKVCVIKHIPIGVELAHSDEMGRYVAQLVKATIIHGRCTAFEEVATLKEPFELTKMSGYCPFSKKDYAKAGNDLASAEYSFLAEATSYPYASIEVPSLFALLPQL
ncbi:hypothetical protein Tco_0889616 [Tanacetum coccineum]